MEQTALSVICVVIGVMLLVASVTMTGYSWGPSRAAQTIRPPNLFIRLLSFVFGLAAIGCGIFVWLHGARF